jgi:MauM/NapG family ferredoxin protein
VKAKHLVLIRRICQILFLGLFLFLLVESRLSEDAYLDYSLVFSGDADMRLEEPVTFFFKLDPLVWLTSLISGHRLIEGYWWALGVIVLTLLLGRVFCSFICPFGTIHHAVSWTHPALKGDRMVRANQKSPAHRIKYFVLIAVLAGGVLGLNLAGFMDPIALLFRSLALAIFPAIGVGLKSIFDAMARSDLKFLNYLSYGGETLVSPLFGYGYPAYKTAWLIGLLFLIIVFLNRIKPRFWCRILCPLGALLGLFSRFCFLKLEKDDEKCTQCKVCSKVCSGAASPMAGDPWENAECLFCFNCFRQCPERALAFRFSWSPRLNQRPDMGRRAVLTGLAAGVSLPLLAGLDSQAHHVADPRVIRPPGALPEADFLKLCQRCGLCMKVCPTNAINPTLGEAGLAGFWTPHLIMTQGYCEYTCTLCGSVCPTGAIAEITAREKIDRPIRIGSAYVSRGRCLPWSGNGPCIVCQEVCPTSPKAVYLKKQAVPGGNKAALALDVPHVDLKRCVGCGICETKCPVRGRPAIRVIAAGESRSVENQILLPDLGKGFP